MSRRLLFRSLTEVAAQLIDANNGTSLATETKDPIISNEHQEEEEEEEEVTPEIYIVFFLFCGIILGIIFRIINKKYGVIF